LKRREPSRGPRDPTPPPYPNSVAYLKWFELFKDSQLQTLIHTALVDNYDIRDAVARVSAARANLGITKADQFPNFTVGGDITTFRTSGSGAFPFAQRRTFGSVILNLLSFEVDVWGRLRSQSAAARAQVQASEEGHKTLLTVLPPGGG